MQFRRHLSPRPATKLAVYPCLVLALYLAWSATWSGYIYTLPGRSGCSATLSGLAAWLQWHLSQVCLHWQSGLATLSSLVDWLHWQLIQVWLHWQSRLATYTVGSGCMITVAIKSGLATLAFTSGYTVESGCMITVAIKSGLATLASQVWLQVWLCALSV